jgi:hypothetical protein
MKKECHLQLEWQSADAVPTITSWMQTGIMDTITTVASMFFNMELFRDG